MSSKTLKITNGKILNYKISAPNYKTIYGSKLITADSTISHNMIAEDDPNGVYSLGDRIGGIASFVGYFNSTNPDNNVQQKYAVFVLDAAYRGKSAWAATNDIVGYEKPMPLPSYTSSETVVSACESATWNGNTMYGTFTAEQLTNSAFDFCRNILITVGGNSYTAQLPNIKELDLIAGENTAFRQALDALDPTLSDYPDNSLESWNIEGTSNNYVLSSNVDGDDYGRRIWYFNITSGSKSWSNARIGTTAYGVIPVFEIPVE